MTKYSYVKYAYTFIYMYSIYTCTTTTTTTTTIIIIKLTKELYSDIGRYSRFFTSATVRVI